MPAAAPRAGFSLTAAHRFIGYGVPAAFLCLALWAGWCLIRNREPGDGFWKLLAGAQVILGVQVLAGVILLLIGHRANPIGPEWLHYLVYGSLFPAGVLMVAHIQGHKHEQVSWIIFGGAAFVNFGLTFRALQTALHWFA